VLRRPPQQRWLYVPRRQHHESSAIDGGRPVPEPDDHLRLADLRVLLLVLRQGGLTPATELWDPVNQRADIDFDPAFDAVETGLAAYFEAASAQFPDGVSIDEWVDEYVSPVGCGVPRSQQEEITIDGVSGRISECPGQVEATVVAGRRLYLFILGHRRGDARAFFDAWVATIDLTPETAAVS
jgi:hypothetical protein